MATLPHQYNKFPQAQNAPQIAEAAWLSDKKKKSKKKKKDKNCCKSFKKKNGKMCKDCPKLENLKKSATC